jgi:predicted HTH domain antitoxin
MTVTIEIPKDAENILREAFGQDLARAAVEAIAVEGYRSGKLSTFEVQTLLGLEDRWETEAWLGSRGVPRSYGLEDLEADRQTIRHGLGDPRR